MLVFSAAERPGAANCRASRAWRCARSWSRNSRYCSKVIDSLAAGCVAARWAAAGKCHHPAAISAVKAAAIVHGLIKDLLSRAPFEQIRTKRDHFWQALSLAVPIKFIQRTVVRYEWSHGIGGKG